MNDSYFTEIDTEEKAYWLGFLSADGCVTERGNSLCLTLQLAEIDRAHVQKFCDAIEYTGPVSSLVCHVKGKDFPAARFSTTSKTFVSSLIPYGITPRKSFTFQPWDGPPSMMRHYWRGYFDGNGHIHRKKDNSTWVISLCGSGGAISAFFEFVTKMGGLGGSVSPHGTSDGIFIIYYGGSKSPQSVAKILYEGASVYLDRKMERATQLICHDTVSSASPVTSKLNIDVVTGLYEEHKNLQVVADILGVDRRTLFLFRKSLGYTVSRPNRITVVT